MFRKKYLLFILPLFCFAPPYQAISQRPNELLIPANGKCLYTSIILGLLLPVLNQPNLFYQRLYSITETKQPHLKPQHLASNYQDINYLHSDQAFQEVISLFLQQTGIKPNIWGGPKEIQRIADKLNIQIQEYIPHPNNINSLVKSDLTTPNVNYVDGFLTILELVKDTALQQEIKYKNSPTLYQGQQNSFTTFSQPQHYRLYYIGPLPQYPPHIIEVTKDLVDISTASQIFGKPFIHPINEEQVYHNLKMLEAYQRLFIPNFLNLFIATPDLTYGQLYHNTKKLLVRLGATLRINLPSKVRQTFSERRVNNLEQKEKIKKTLLPILQKLIKFRIQLELLQPAYKIYYKKTAIKIQQVQCKKTSPTLFTPKDVEEINKNQKARGEKKLFDLKKQQCTNLLFEELYQHIITMPQKLSWFLNISSYTKEQKEKNNAIYQTLSQEVTKIAHNYDLQGDILIIHPEKLFYYELKRLCDKKIASLQQDFILVLHTLQPFYKRLGEQTKDRLDKLIKEHKRLLRIQEIAKDEKKAKKTIDDLQHQIYVLKYQRKLLIIRQQKLLHSPRGKNNITNTSIKKLAKRFDHVSTYELKRLQGQLNNTNTKLDVLTREVLEVRRQQARYKTTCENIGVAIIGGGIGMFTGFCFVTNPLLGLVIFGGCLLLTKKIDDKMDQEGERRYYSVT